MTTHSRHGGPAGGMGTRIAKHLVQPYIDTLLWLTDHTGASSALQGVRMRRVADPGPPNRSPGPAKLSSLFPTRLAALLAADLDQPYQNGAHALAGSVWTRVAAVAAAAPAAHTSPRLQPFPTLYLVSRRHWSLAGRRLPRDGEDSGLSIWHGCRSTPKREYHCFIAAGDGPYSVGCLYD
jgi:hypothetical protein